MKSFCKLFRSNCYSDHSTECSLIQKLFICSYVIWQNIFRSAIHKPGKLVQQQMYFTYNSPMIWKLNKMIFYDQRFKRWSLSQNHRKKKKKNKNQMTNCCFHPCHTFFRNKGSQWQPETVSKSVYIKSVLFA